MILGYCHYLFHFLSTLDPPLVQLYGDPLLLLANFLHLGLKQCPQMNPTMNVTTDIITSTQVTDIRAVLSITVVVAAWLGVGIPVF